MIAEELHLAGVAAAREGRFADARGLMLAALEAGGSGQAPAARGLIQRNLTEVNRRLGLLREAVVAGQAAVRLLGRDAVALGNLGSALADVGEAEAALACFDEALEVDALYAAAHLGRAEILLCRGDFEAGWAAYAWRVRLPGVAPMVPDDAVAVHWDGAVGAGTLLVVADQGFGDMIQFARFLAWAAERCGRLVVHAPAEVCAVFAVIPGVATVIADWRDMAFSAWCALADLPFLAGAGWAAAAAAVPYVAAPEASRARWRGVLGAAGTGRTRVGLVWAGRAEQIHDPARSVALARLAGLAEVDGVDWVSLQVGEARAQVGDWPRPMEDIGAALGDFGDTAAVVSLLDLVVSVDTAVAHLAGAMGRPVWTLLRHRADWRWGADGESSAWYPTMRLFRQARAGDWDSVVEAVVRALAGAGDTSLPRPSNEKPRLIGL